MKDERKEILALINNCLCSGPCEKRDDVVGYLTYANDMADAVYELKPLLIGHTGHREIVFAVLRILCKFYGGDWCGILDVDEALGTWSPFWWYDAKTNGMTQSDFERYEPTAPYPRWLDALHESQPVVLADTDTVKQENEEEYRHYQRQKLTSVIGAPYHKRTVGFLIVKNATRHLQRVDLIQLMAYLTAMEVHDWKVLDGRDLMLEPSLRSGKPDVEIELFGGLKITTANSVLTSREIRAPKMRRVLVYLFLNRQRAVPALELEREIWPETTSKKNPGENVKYMIYRFRSKFNKLLPKDFIMTTCNGYCLNPKLKIVTDVEMFNLFWESGMVMEDTGSKCKFFEQALAAYKGDLVPEFSAERWLWPDCLHYRSKYKSLLDTLLGLLNVAEDYDQVVEKLQELQAG